MGREEVTEMQDSLVGTFSSNAEYLAEMNDMITSLSDFVFGSKPSEAEQNKVDGSFLTAMRIQNENIRKMVFKLRDIKSALTGK